MLIKTTVKELIDFLTYTKIECDGCIDGAKQIAKVHPEDSSNVFNKQYCMYKDTVKYCDSQIKRITKKYDSRDIIEIFIDID